MNVLRRVIMRANVNCAGGLITAQGIYVRKAQPLPKPGEKIQLVREGDPKFYLGEVTRVDVEAHTYDIQAVVA
jgi:hypothetical protein